MAPSSSPSSSTRASRRPSPSSSSTTSASSSSNAGGSAPGLKTKLVPVYDPSPPKRDAVQRACDGCRRNKQKCNGLSPCSRCAGKRECVYETQNKKNYTRLPTEMGAKQRKRLRWSRVWDEEGDVEMEEEEVKVKEEPKPSPKVKETVWVKSGKKVAKQASTRASSRGKKVEFEEQEEVDELESEGSESEEEEDSKKDVVMEEKVECCEGSSPKPSSSPHLSISLPSPPLLSVHPPTAFPPSHPFSTLSLPPTQPHLSPPTPSSSRLPPRQSISSPPLLPHKILRPHLITAQSVSSFRSTIVPSPINSTPPPTPFSFTSLLPIPTYLSVPDVIVKPPTPIDAEPRKRARRDWEIEVEEGERVEQVGGVFQDFRFLPPPIGGGKLVVGWSR